MVLDALEDAGLTLADVDGVCHPESAVAFAEYLGLHPTFVESTMTGGSSYEVHVEHAAAAIAAGVCDVVVSVYASTPRSDRTRRRPRGPGAAWRGPTPWPSGSCPSGSACPWAPTRWRRHVTCTSSARHRSSWRHCGADAGVGRTEPARPLPRPADDRRRARLAAAGEPPAPPRLLPGDRRRRRVRHDQRGARPDAPQAAGLRPRRGDLHRPHGDHPDARPHHHARGRSRVPAPSPWPAWDPPTSTCSWATTASPSPRCSTSKTSASAPRARVDRSPPQAASGRAGRSP